MRILYLTFDDLSIPFAWSVHVRSIINGLVARGHAVSLICPGGVAPGVNAECGSLPPGRFQHLAGSLGTFVRAGRSFGPDVVYVRGIHATITPVLAAARLGRPMVVEVNGLLEHEVKGWRRAAVRKAHRFTLPRVARVVTVSPLLAEALEQDYGIPKDRIDVVPNGVDTQLFRPAEREAARRKLGLPADRPIAVCVAGFFAHHAVDLLIAGAAKAGALLVLVGKSGPSGGNLVHAGRLPHESVPDYLAAADLCAYVLRAPHPQFGFSPLKVYEYMAATRPVVAATDLPDLRAFINDSGIGRATACDEDAFAEAMTELLRDPQRRQQMGRAGRALAEARYSWDRAVGQVEETLRRAVSG